MEASFAFVASGGTLVFVGVRAANITFSDPEFHRKEMTLKATRNATRADFETVMSAVPDGCAKHPWRHTGRPARDHAGLDARA